MKYWLWTINIFIKVYLFISKLNLSPPHSVSAWDSALKWGCVSRVNEGPYKQAVAFVVTAS